MILLDPKMEIRSRENVRNTGEVFTPFWVVDDMIKLIPDSAWSDETYCFLEPSCGNGQFLVKILQKRLALGVSLENSLNTMVGMDISVENIRDSHLRLYEIAVQQLEKEKVVRGSKEWVNRVLRIAAIVNNNIFRVDDTISYIKSGKLSEKLFVFHDPSGNKQVLSKERVAQRLKKIKQEYLKSKNGKGMLRIFGKVN